jgi:recombination protein RecA
VIDKSGSWYSWNSQRIGQGRDNAREFLKKNPDLAQQIEEQVRGNSTKVVDSLLLGSPDPGEE